MKKLIVLALFSAFFAQKQASAQSDNLWRTLAKVTYKKEHNELLGYKIDVPVFDKIIKQLEGKEVRVRGYIVPTDGYKSHAEFVFSAFPYQMCFFCGQAGPETVMEVHAVTGIEYTTEPVILKGKLRLNDKDVNRLMYAIWEAEMVE